MILIVGLGNPGKKYIKTRHNIGFRAVDEIATNFQFSIFNFQSIFNAQISKGKINGQNVILAKPQTFMNNSGIAVKRLVKNLKLKIKKLIVIHDDIDLPLGKIRIVKNRGAAGHKGVESIIKELRTKNFVRFRIGIKPNSKLSPSQFFKENLGGQKTQNLEKLVLGKFNKEEKKIIKEAAKKTIEAMELAINKGIEFAMTMFNQ
ncbi:MAG: aminoacyl-tRNA hydrolase [Candidatus Nealsonbacteria bacterium CG_4_9_14_3_um_filter_35_11]|uniref:Peptidyl-tRNA hydrolase n=2 Tax=Candidatus Nealsoniibacteriota TaxID=1817911 RepID=A0A2M7DAH4_9BACT|nr:MAG: aminoacyl-tRNA hydrolase [Candidatus Nealsonbacteria bacterium CG11_big_fil_rev_8_21_14_0_20_35_11]PIV45472.1 MAG: aminoacyl-tRNA hydrolase [Candidatus Nealsonbacteria bacterium CG02_land_8_20_14_3_00_34_20]PIZ89739.1 MAG: aminoacyl-tRNA hydrolase [Candidatus Nealsonbacteria bacterium CG_4_10_14_0_2_um_filter_35_20]PJA84669.1 MAG: aminoacyl-tRNA hydrolase [Candidatus Nealsonbacteria bacterium CG_4_9_14_3_um_filter_35_11]